MRTECELILIDTGFGRWDFAAPSFKMRLFTAVLPSRRHPGATPPRPLDNTGLCVRITSTVDKTEDKARSELDALVEAADGWGYRVFPRPDGGEFGYGKLLVAVR